MLAIRKAIKKNLGTIKSSNLCTEIIEYSNEEETAVCNLASIGLSKFVVQSPSPFTGKIELYSKTSCSYCKLAKNLLNKVGIPFEEINVDSDDKRQNVYNRFSKEANKKN